MASTDEHDPLGAAQIITGIPGASEGSVEERLRSMLRHAHCALWIEDCALAAALDTNVAVLRTAMTAISRGDQLQELGDWKVCYRCGSGPRRYFLCFPAPHFAQASAAQKPSVTEQLARHDSLMHAESPAEGNSVLKTRGGAASAAAHVAACANQVNQGAKEPRFESSVGRGAKAPRFESATPSRQHELEWVLAAFQQQGCTALLDLCIVEAAWKGGQGKEAPDARSLAARLEQQLRESGVQLHPKSTFVRASHASGHHHSLDEQALRQLVCAAQSARTMRQVDPVLERIEQQRDALLGTYGKTDGRLALPDGCSTLRFMGAVETFRASVSGKVLSTQDEICALARNAARQNTSASAAFRDNFMARLRYLYYDCNISGAKLAQVLVSAWSLWFDFPPPMGAVPDKATVDRYMERLHSIDIELKYADVRDALKRAENDGFTRGGVSLIADDSELKQYHGKTKSGHVDYVTKDDQIGRVRIMFCRVAGGTADMGSKALKDVLVDNVGLQGSAVDQSCSDGAAVAVKEMISVQAKGVVVNGMERPQCNYHDDQHASVLQAKAAVEAAFGESGRFEDEHFQQVLYQPYLLSRADIEVARLVYRTMLRMLRGCGAGTTASTSTANAVSDAGSDADASDNDEVDAADAAIITANDAGTADADDGGDESKTELARPAWVPEGKGNARLPSKPNTGRWNAQATAAQRHVGLCGFPLDDSTAAVAQRAQLISEMREDPTLQTVEHKYAYPSVFIKMAERTRKWKRRGWRTLWRRCRDARLRFQCVVVGELGLKYVQPSVSFNYQPGFFNDRQGHLVPDLFARLLRVHIPFWTAAKCSGWGKILPLAYSMFEVLSEEDRAEMKAQMDTFCKAGYENAVRVWAPKLGAPWCFAGLVHPETSQTAASALLEVLGSRGDTPRVTGDEQMVRIFGEVGKDKILQWTKVWSWQATGCMDNLHDLAKSSFRTPEEFAQLAKPMSRWALHFARRWVSSTLIEEISFSQVKEAKQKNMGELAIEMRMHHLSDNAYAYRQALRMFMAKAKRAAAQKQSGGSPAKRKFGSEVTASGRGGLMLTKDALGEHFRLQHRLSERYTPLAMTAAQKTSAIAANGARSAASTAFAKAIPKLAVEAEELLPLTAQPQSAAMQAKAEEAVKLKTPEGRESAIVELLCSGHYWNGGAHTPLKSAAAREDEIKTVFGEAILAGTTNNDGRITAVKAEIARMRLAGEDPVETLEFEDSVAAAFIDGGSCVAQKKGSSLFQRFCEVDESE